MSTSLGLVIVAAGGSARMAGTDKVWATLGDRPVVAHSLARLGRVVDEVVLVVRPDRVEQARREFRSIVHRLVVVAGGRERQDSVARGLAGIGPVDAIAIHDGARPLASARLLDKGLALLTDFDGAVPVVPVTDTIKSIGIDGVVAATVDRTQLRAAQTPQVFRSTVIRAAHEDGSKNARVMTDDAALAEAAGYRIVTYPGETANTKITTSQDLRMMTILVGSDLQH